MADDWKMVGVRWEVNFKQLVEAEKVQQEYNKTLQETEKSLEKVSKTSGKLAAYANRLSASVSKEALQQDRLRAYAERLSTSLAEQARAQEEAARAAEQATQATGQAADELGEHVAAAEKSAAATKENEKTQKEQTAAVEESTVAWGKLIKRLTLYVVGAASVFRVVMKLRREFNENVEILFKNTEEYGRMKEAQDDLKAAFLAFLGTEEGFKQYFENISDWINQFIDGLIILRAELDRVKFVIGELRPTGEALAEARGTVLSQRGLREVIQNLQEAGGAAQLTADAQDVYNRSIEETRERVEKWGDAISEAREKQEKLADEQRRWEQLLEQIVRAEEQRIRALIDLYTDYERKLEDIIETANRALADLALEGARRREDIERDYQRRLQDIERQQQETRARNEERYRLKLLRIEMRYRERLIRIQEDFDDAMYDAIAKRDATAALMAIRRRDREQARALRERNNAITLAQAEYNAQLEEQRRSLERMREEARIARQRALEDLAVYLQREREDIETSRQRELEDLDIFLERRRSDIEQDYEWQITRARAHYRQDEAEYAAHLRDRLTELQNYYRQVVALYNTYSGLLASPLGTPIGGPTGVQQFAEGGAAYYDQPTTIRVAERVPEMVMVQPVSPPSGNVSISGGIQHQITGSVSAAMAGFEGRLGVVVTEAVVRVMGDMLQ